jgi:hypothetical protein
VRGTLPAWSSHGRLAQQLMEAAVSQAAGAGLNEVIDEPDRSVGVLLDYELIVPTRRGYRPSDEVLYSLRLRPWRSPGW